MLCGLSRPVASFEVGAAPLRKNLSWVQDPSKSRKTAQAMWTTCSPRAVLSRMQQLVLACCWSFRRFCPPHTSRCTSPGRPRRRASQAAALKTCRDLGADVGAGGWTCWVVLKANQRGSTHFLGPALFQHTPISELLASLVLVLLC